MVELCELKMMSKEMDYWPADIDQHVAQLDFDNSTSMMIEQSSLFASSTGGVDITDPDNDDDEEDEDARAEAAALAAAISTDVVISTDSLDMDLIRDCSGGGAANKNEYKLTFEDSGQWTTTSGIGASVTTNSNGSPPMRRVIYRSPNHQTRQKQANDHHQQRTTTVDGAVDHNTASGRGVFGGMLDRHFGLRLLEQLNNDEWAEAIGEANEDEKRKLIDNLLNNVATTATNFDADETMTTWGRIQKTEPPFDSYSSLQEQRHLRQQLRSNGEFGSDADNCSKRPFSCGDVLLLPAAPPPISNLRMTTTADANSKKWRTTNLTDNSNFNNNSKSDAKTSTHSSAQRTSLLANFVEQHHSKHSNSSQTHSHSSRGELALNEEPTEYEYNEVYMGDGRYVDVNKNEIGYIPENTASIQRSGYQSSDAHDGNFAQPRRIATADSSAGTSSYGGGAALGDAFQSRAARRNPSGRIVSGNGGEMPPSFTAPDLKFLSLMHKTPSFCRSQISLDEMLKRARNGSLLFSENIFGDEKLCLEASSELSILDRQNAQPDSGLGSSSSSGPSHIEDWPSLAVLLPRHVVDACSFFKTNSSLLTGSSASGSLNNIERKHSSINNIERKAFSSSGGAKSRADSDENIVNESGDAACRTCFNVRRRRLHPPPWAHRQPNAKSALCDCSSCCGGCCCAPTTQSEILTSHDRVPSHRLSNSASASALAARMSKLNAAELSVVGLPLYNAKRALVERVVEGVAEIARGASAVVLYSALERLLADGLLEGGTPWDVIVQITGPGPATNKIFNLVKSLEASEKPENSRVGHFFKEVLNLHSLEGWLSYVVLKENVLARIYADTAFLLRANSAYRSLFWRLIESIELLSVLSQCHKNSRRWQTDTSTSCYAASDDQAWGSASRLPSDSRIPKSSSIPEKLTPGPVLTVRIADETPKTSKLKNAVLIANKQALFDQEIAVQNYAGVANTPSTSQLAVGDNKKSSATFPRDSSTLAAIYKRRASKIPIASPPTARSVCNSHTMISSPLTTLRSRSLHSRSTRTATPGLGIIAKARERVSESDALNASQTVLALNKGERVRVLSIRGDISRCCRVNLRFGALLNGVVPTRKLDLC